MDLYLARSCHQHPAQNNPDLHCTVHKQHVNIRYVAFSFGKSRVDPGSSTTMPCICLLPMLAPDYSHQSSLTSSLRLSMPRPQVRLPINGSGSYRVPFGLRSRNCFDRIVARLRGWSIRHSGWSVRHRTAKPHSRGSDRIRGTDSCHSKVIQSTGQCLQLQDWIVQLEIHNFGYFPEVPRIHDSMLLPLDLTDSLLSLQPKHRSSLRTLQHNGMRFGWDNNTHWAYLNI